jgi:hypothetical protein
MAVDVYKVKGTYNVLNMAFYMIGLDVTIWDLWTRDYLTFTRFPPHYHTGIPGGFVPESGLLSDSGWHFDENNRFDGGGGFKSPHFDLVISMDRLFMWQGSIKKLFVGELWPTIEEIVEEFTPVNTVPHFYLGLYCLCKEDYISYEILSSEVKTCITNDWTHSIRFFDQVAPDDIYLDQPGVDVTIGTGDTLKVTFDSALIPSTDPQLAPAARVQANKVQLFLDTALVAYDNGAGSWISPGGDIIGGSIDYVTGRVVATFAVAPGVGELVKFHSLVDNLWMDWTFDSMLQAITVFKIGTGHKGATPLSSMTALADIAPYVGTVTGYTVTNEKITFTMTVPLGVVINGASELGLFHSGTGEMMVVSFFPDFDKPTDVITDITVDVLRTK